MVPMHEFLLLRQRRGELSMRVRMPPSSVGQQRRHRQPLRVSVETPVVELELFHDAARLIESMQALEERCKSNCCAPGCRRIRHEPLQRPLRQVRRARGDEEQGYGYGD